MIIIEGPDNTGKSTLINKLVTDLDLIHAPFKFNPHNKKDVCSYTEKFYSSVVNYLRTTDDNTLKKIIWDRIYFSELVYAPVKRGKICININDLAILPHLIASTKPLIIYCKLSLDKIMENYLDRQQYVDEKEIVAVYEAYEKLFNELKYFFPYYVEYNYEQNRYDVIKAIVDLYLKEL